MDFSIYPERIVEIVDDPGPMLFFLHVNDTETMQYLVETFPDGVLSEYDSKVENKNFMMFFVPPSQGAVP
jgi:hypothetical protein